MEKVLGSLTGAGEGTGQFVWAKSLLQIKPGRGSW